jgi:hypothetical protein
MAQTVKRAKISPAISFHGLRTRGWWGKYGHLSPSYVADAIGDGAPRFGLASNNVKTMRGRR